MADTGAGRAGSPSPIWDPRAAGRQASDTKPMKGEA
jgi:hypothetical protein